MPWDSCNWANPATRDLMANFTTGLVGEWTIPQAVTRDYLQQLSAVRREEVTAPRGRFKYIWKQIARDDHYNDCELMITVAAVICGLITDTRTNA